MYIGENVVIRGNVKVSEDCSIWHNAVIRSESEHVFIGKNTNIQDLVMIHTGIGYPVSIGEHVTIGHSAVIHGCSIGNGTMIGMGSIIMNGAVIGNHCLVGAGSLITQNKHFEDHTLITGSPAKAVRKLTSSEEADLLKNADHYVRIAQQELKKLEDINH